MNIIRQKIMGWKTYALAFSTIAGVFAAWIGGEIEAQPAIAAVVAALFACFLGAKIDRAAK